MDLKKLNYELHPQHAAAEYELKAHIWQACHIDILYFNLWPFPKNIKIFKRNIKPETIIIQSKQVNGYPANINCTIFRLSLFLVAYSDPNEQNVVNGRKQKKALHMQGIQRAKKNDYNDSMNQMLAPSAYRTDSECNIIEQVEFAYGWMASNEERLYLVFCSFAHSLANFVERNIENMQNGKYKVFPVC